MKFLTTGLLMLMWCIKGIAQEVPVDRSPLDVIYFPVNYPVLKVQAKITGEPVVRLLYSRPSRNGRPIFGDLIEYGKVWRMGANEATEIEFFSPVRMGNERIKKGRYTLYAIPETHQWTIILNRETDTWGTFKYDAKKDVVRITLPVVKPAKPVEHLSAAFEARENGFVLQMMWDDSMVIIPFIL